ncbi:hypothetical protein ABZ897_54225 [Nonomuraea sp. NPDC046802]|uniref:hypothetical protein n=1 Tax=Nonomuraea sp. NPDC046802 TaxID=3154919 RepID=UPI0033F23BF3
METDTALSPWQQLELLQAELVARGWAPELRGTEHQPYLCVANPDDPGLNGMVTASHGHYRWTWGPVLGPLEDVPRTADTILTVLREVGP